MRAQFGAIFDDCGVWRGEVFAYAPWESVISGRYVLAGGESGPFGAAGRTVDQYRAKPLQRGRPICELEQESQNGNSGLASMKTLSA